jgi:hypothetical protein
MKVSLHPNPFQLTRREALGFSCLGPRALVNTRRSGRSHSDALYCDVPRNCCSGCSSKKSVAIRSHSISCDQTTKWQKAVQGVSMKHMLWRRQNQTTWGSLVAAHFDARAQPTRTKPKPTDGQPTTEGPERNHRKENGNHTDNSFSLVLEVCDLKRWSPAKRSTV